MSQDVSGKLLTHFAMDWTEGTVGDQPIGPIFHVPHSSSKSDFLSGASANKKKTTDKSTMTITNPIPGPPPLPTTPPHLPFPLPHPQVPIIHSPKKSLDCEVCKKHFTRTNDLRDHKINVHKMENPYICLTCSKTYSNKRNLNQHIKNKHQNAYKFTCLEKHKLLHFPMKKCNLCGLILSRDKLLIAKHMNMHFQKRKVKKKPGHLREK